MNKNFSKKFSYSSPWSQYLCRTYRLGILKTWEENQYLFTNVFFFSFFSFSFFFFLYLLIWSWHHTYVNNLCLWPKVAILSVNNNHSKKKNVWTINVTQLSYSNYFLFGFQKKKLFYHPNGVYLIKFALLQACRHFCLYGLESWFDYL